MSYVTVVYTLSPFHFSGKRALLCYTGMWEKVVCVVHAHTHNIILTLMTDITIFTVFKLLIVLIKIREKEIYVTTE